MILGAFIYIFLAYEKCIVPNPSIGFPKASTTLPSSAYPVGTFTIFPVLFIMSPYLIALSFPNITTLTLSVYKLRAIPFTPYLNSIIYPACTF